MCLINLRCVFSDFEPRMYCFLISNSKGRNHKKLEEVEIVNGFLGISDSTIESLETLKEVKGNLFINSYSVYSNIKS